MPSFCSFSFLTLSFFLSTSLSFFSSRRQSHIGDQKLSSYTGHFAHLQKQKKLHRDLDAHACTAGWRHSRSNSCRDAWSAVWLKQWRGGWLQTTGRGRTTGLSPLLEVQAHASLHIIYLAEDSEVFLFALHLCLSHPGVNPPGSAAELCCCPSPHFSLFGSPFQPCTCLLWHALGSDKQPGPV